MSLLMPQIISILPLISGMTLKPTFLPYYTSLSFYHKVYKRQALMSAVRSIVRSAVLGVVLGVLRSAVRSAVRSVVRSVVRSAVLEEKYNKLQSCRTSL